MKNTERHTADTQITDAIDSKISASPRFYKLQSCLLFATYRPYDVNNYFLLPYSPGDSDSFVTAMCIKFMFILTIVLPLTIMKTYVCLTFTVAKIINNYCNM